MTYAEKLLDPRWQKRRLQIMDRDGFACRCCGDSENTLNVHHKFYTSGLMPWEYQDAALITLCKTCHKLAEDQKKFILANLNSGNDYRIIGYMKGLSVLHNGVYSITLKHEYEFKGFTDALTSFFDTSRQSELQPDFSVFVKEYIQLNEEITFNLIDEMYGCFLAIAIPLEIPA